jgi:hypothetical protein
MGNNIAAAVYTADQAVCRTAVTEDCCGQLNSYYAAEELHNRTNIPRPALL